MPLDLRSAVIGAIGTEWITARTLAYKLDQWSIKSVTAELREMADQGIVWRYIEITPTRITSHYCRKHDVGDPLIGARQRLPGLPTYIATILPQIEADGFTIVRKEVAHAES